MRKGTRQKLKTVYVIVIPYLTKTMRFFFNRRHIILYKRFGKLGTVSVKTIFIYFVNFLFKYTNYDSLRTFIRTLALRMYNDVCTILHAHS